MHAQSLTRALVYIFLLINVVVLKHFPEYLFFIDLGTIQRYLLHFGAVSRVFYSIFTIDGYLTKGSPRLLSLSWASAAAVRRAVRLGDGE